MVATIKKTIQAKDRQHLRSLIVDEMRQHGACPNLNHIDVSKVTSFDRLFFNLVEVSTGEEIELSGWSKDMLKAVNFPLLGCSFNGDISKWDTSNVEDFSFMFCRAHHFNGDISKWNTSKVRSMYQTFFHAHDFNQDISSWDVSNVSTVVAMFSSAYNFNKDISNWDLTNAYHSGNLFKRCRMKEEYKPKLRDI